jgi:hypothetical protein
MRIEANSSPISGSARTGRASRGWVSRRSGHPSSTIWTAADGLLIWRRTTPDPTPIANHVRLRLAGCQPPQRFLALVWGFPEQYARARASWGLTPN